MKSEEFSQMILEFVKDKKNGGERAVQFIRKM